MSFARLPLLPPPRASVRLLASGTSPLCCPRSGGHPACTPVPPRWPWSWGHCGTVQLQLPPPSSTGWPGDAGDSWHSAPWPSGPCCCSHGSAPRTTVQGRRHLAAHGRGSACCAGCHGVDRRPQHKGRAPGTHMAVRRGGHPAPGAGGGRAVAVPHTPGPAGGTAAPSAQGPWARPPLWPALQGARCG